MGGGWGVGEVQEGVQEEVTVMPEKNWQKRRGETFQASVTV